MSELKQQIRSLCVEAKVPEIFQRLEAQDNSQEALALSFHERVHDLLQAQVEMNHQNKVARNRRAAKLRWSHAVLEDFKDDDDIEVPFSKIKELGHCHWLEKKRHIILTGATGVGKTHLACALAQEAITKEHTALYCHYSDLLRDFKIACKIGEEKVVLLLKRLTKPNVLLIDDWGMEQLNNTTRGLLFQLIEKRDQSGSLIITSQFSASDWYDVFIHKNAADSIIDRIVSYSDEYELKGPSHRSKVLRGGHDEH